MAEPKEDKAKAKVSNNYIQNLRKQLDDYEAKAKTIQAKIKEIENAFSLPENSSDAKMKDLNNFYEAEKKALKHLEKEMEVILEELIVLED